MSRNNLRDDQTFPTLSSYQNNMLTHYYGLGGVKATSQTVMAEKVGVARNAVCSTVWAGLRKLNVPTAKKLQREYLVKLINEERGVDDGTI